MRMIQVPNPPAELFYKFNDIEYHDEPHKYYLKGKPLTSVTTVIHKYEEEFDEDHWSQIKADEFGVTQNDIKYCWKFINERATIKGSAIHDYIENLFLNKKFPYPQDKIIKHFGYDPILDEYSATKKYVDNFYKISKNRLIPIKTELVCYDEEFMVAGMVDMLFYNVKAKQFQIWDWKTNSADKAFNEDERHIRPLKNPLFMLTNTAMDIYSLQLSTYKYILEKNTGIELGDSHIVWFSHKNSNFEIIKCEDYTYYADEMLRDFSLNKAS